MQPLLPPLLLRVLHLKIGTQKFDGD